MRSLLVLILLFLNIVCFAQNEQLELLEKAYATKSDSLKQLFFQNWENEIKPYTEAELLQFNDTILEAFKVYEAFYLTNLKKKQYFLKKKYLLLQNQLSISFTDKIYYNNDEINEYIVKNIQSKTSLTDSVKLILLKRSNGKYSDKTIDKYGPKIKALDWTNKNDILKIKDLDNFRFKSNRIKKNVLFFSSKYDTIFDKYLGERYKRRVDQKIIKRNKDLQVAKCKFIETHIPATNGMLGKYIGAFPLIGDIIFDKNKEFVIVNFNFGGESGYAILKKNKFKWKIIKQKITIVV